MQRQRAKHGLLLSFITPLLLGIGFIFKTVYNIVFGWWLDPQLQRNANKALLDDVLSNFYFLFPEGQVVTETHPRPLPFDLATVKVRWNNLVFYFTRGRGDEIVSVAPKHVANESYELGPLIPALERRHYSERDIVQNFSDAGRVLRSRLRELDAAFAEGEYEKVRARL